MRVVDEPRRETEQVIDNRLDYMIDPPRAGPAAQVREKQADRFKEHTTVSTYFFFLNSKIPPFDNRKVREAANLAIDNRAVVRLFGGLLTPGCNFLPPGCRATSRSSPARGARRTGPPIWRRRRSWSRRPAPRARRSPCTAPPSRGQARDRVLRRPAEPDRAGGPAQGARPQRVHGVGSAKTKAQAGFANFFQDYPHPANFMANCGRQLDPAPEQPQPRQRGRPEINRQIAELRGEPDLDKVTGAVGRPRPQADRARVVGPGRPPPADLIFLSERMDPECARFHPLYQNDYTAFCLR